MGTFLINWLETHPAPWDVGFIGDKNGARNSAQFFMTFNNYVLTDTIIILYHGIPGSELGRLDLPLKWLGKAMPKDSNTADCFISVFSPPGTKKTAKTTYLVIISQSRADIYNKLEDKNLDISC